MVKSQIVEKPNIFENKMEEVQKIVHSENKSVLPSFIIDLLKKFKNSEQQEIIYQFLLENSDKIENISIFADIFLKKINKTSKCSILALKLLVISIVRDKFICTDLFSLVLLSFNRNIAEDPCYISHLMINCIENNLFDCTEMETLLLEIHKKMLNQNTKTTFYLLLIFGTIVQKDAHFHRFMEKKLEMSFLDVLEHSVKEISTISSCIKNKIFFDKYQNFHR